MPARLHEAAGARGDPLERAAGEIFLCPKRKQVFLLGCHQVRAVEREQGIPLADEFAGEIHEDVLDPSADLRVNVRDSGFVISNLAGRAYFLGQMTVARRLGAHSGQLLLLRRHEDRVWPSGCARWRGGFGCRRRFLLLDKLHAADRAIAGLVRLIVFVHRAVVHIP